MTTNGYRYDEMLDRAVQAMEASGKTIYLYIERGADSYNFTADHTIVSSRDIVDLEKIVPSENLQREKSIRPGIIGDNLMPWETA